MNNSTKLIIKKDSSKKNTTCHGKIYEHQYPSKKDIQSVINEVNPSDIIDYLISAIEDNWSPNCYWNIKSKEDKMFVGKLEWLIYSYLIHNEILMIEDKYTTETTYKDRLSFYNPLEKDLYRPIIKRMTNERYLIDMGEELNTDLDTYYKLGPIYWRNANLDILI